MYGKGQTYDWGMLQMLRDKGILRLSGHGEAGYEVDRINSGALLKLGALRVAGTLICLRDRGGLLLRTIR